MMRLTSFLSFAIVGTVSTSANPISSVIKRSPAPELVNGKYLVDRQSQFDNHVTWTFEGGSLPQGLYASNYPVGSTHLYRSENVNIRDGYLELLVNGGQTSMPYTCGEVATEVANIRYASVRTVAIFTEPAGVCNGKPPSRVGQGRGEFKN
jgi:hypothetical protein